MDAIIGSSLLIPFAHGISVVCFVLANKIFAYFPVGKTIGIMTVAYPAVLLGVSFFL